MNNAVLGKIVEKYRTQANFCKKTGFSKMKLYRHLRGESEFKISDMIFLAKHLGIEDKTEFYDIFIAANEIKCNT